MKKACKSPSEWLKLLCRDWAVENIEIAEATDLKFLAYKSYLKGKLSSQLLCRISIPELGKEDGENIGSVDFWKTLGIQDEFDIRFIISQVEKFCALYSIRNLEDVAILDETTLEAATNAAEAATAGLTVSPLHNFLGASLDLSKPSPVRRGEPRRLPCSMERREHFSAMSKLSEDCKISEAKELTREEKRQQKLLDRQKREQHEQKKKDAALRRASDLVLSNRVPIEITRGARVARAVHRMVKAAEKKDTCKVRSAFKEDLTEESSSTDGTVGKNMKKTKRRSDISVSTASDLDQIVTHSNNLFLKYNAIAREHNQKISWALISRELGMHVKVREKYARMHSRALQRGFDFDKNGDYLIKDHPKIFIEPISKKARPLATVEESAFGKSSLDDHSLPASLIDHTESSHVLHSDHGQDVHMEDMHQIHEDPTHPSNSLDHHDHLPMYSRDMSQHITDDQVAAAVDAAIKTVPVNHTTDYAAAQEAAEAALTVGTTSFHTEV